MPAYLITGATGQQGSGAITPLLEQGATIHALTRTPDSPAALALKARGVRLFPGDIGDFEAVQHAAQGTSGAFLNPPRFSGPGSRVKPCETFIRAIKTVSTVQTLIVSTSIGLRQHQLEIGRESHASHYINAMLDERPEIDTLARNSGILNVTILKPPSLDANYLLPVVPYLYPDLSSKNEFVTALKSTTKMPHLDGRDVGKYVAAALLDPARFKGKEIDLAAENLTASEIAEILSTVTGRRITAPIARFDEHGEAINLTGRIVPLGAWHNTVDLSVDVEELERTYGIRNLRLKEFLQEHSEQLEKVFAN